MKNLIAVVLLVAILAPSEGHTRDAQPLTDQQIRQLLIDKSIREYPGNCPCPYNSARNGSRCGGRSAWSKKGGYAPLCFDADISDAMVKQFRSSQRTTK